MIKFWEKKIAWDLFQTVFVNYWGCVCSFLDKHWATDRRVFPVYYDLPSPTCPVLTGMMNELLPCDIIVYIITSRSSQIRHAVIQSNHSQERLTSYSNQIPRKDDLVHSSFLYHKRVLTTNHILPFHFH